MRLALWIKANPLWTEAQWLELVVENADVIRSQEVPAPDVRVAKVVATGPKVRSAAQLASDERLRERRRKGTGSLEEPPVPFLLLDAG